jgi:uncharacterized protein with HEPN domain
MPERGAKLYLADIENSLEKIEKYTSGLSFEGFVANGQAIDAVVRNFEVIDEAVRNIPEEIKEAYPEIPWEKMIGMRNKVIHEYFSVDEEIVWQTIHEDLPGFRNQIAKILIAMK